MLKQVQHDGFGLSGEREPQKPICDRHQGLRLRPDRSNDLRMPRIEPAGERAEGRKDQLALGGDEAAAGDLAAAMVDPELGVEMAGQLGPRFGGVAAYGLIYFGFHDVIVHKRLPHRLVPRSAYLKRIVQAHRLHHAVESRDGAVSFGFIWAPPPERLKSQLEKARLRAPAERQ